MNSLIIFILMIKIINNELKQKIITNLFYSFLIL